MELNWCTIVSILKVNPYHLAVSKIQLKFIIGYLTQKLKEYFKN